MEYSKLKELEQRYKDYDESEKKYFYDILYTNNLSVEEPISFLRRETGYDNFKNGIAKILEFYDPYTIIVRDYTGSSPKAKNINPDITVQIKNTTPSQSIIYPQQIASKKEPETVKPENNFQGFGSIDDYFGHQENMLNKKFEVLVLTKDKENLEIKNNELQAQIDTLKTEIGELRNENDELTEVNDELEKYRPDGFTIAGMNGTKLLGAIGKEMLNGYVRKNPKVIQELTGISGEQLSGLFGIDSSPVVANDEPEQNVPVSEINEDEQTKAKRIITDALQDWMLHEISNNEFKQLHNIFIAIHNNKENLTLISELLKDDENAEKKV